MGNKFHKAPHWLVCEAGLKTISRSRMCIAYEWDDADEHFPRVYVPGTLDGIGPVRLASLAMSAQGVGK